VGTLFKKHGNWYIDYYANGRRIRKKIGKSKKVAQVALVDAELAVVKNELGVATKRQKSGRFFSMNTENMPRQILHPHL